MRRILIMLIGLPLLAVGAVLLWMSFGWQPSETRTTGGVLYTQAEVAAQGGAAAMLDTVTDVDLGGVAAIPMAVDVTGDAAQDLASVDSMELEAAPPMVDQRLNTFSSAPLTNDVLLDDQTAVAVAPIAGSEAPVPDGQGGMTSSTAGYEQRVVELEWPAEFQVGRAGLVRVKLKVLEGGLLQPVAEIDNNEVLATPILISDRYADYNALVTATIAAPDFTIDTSSPATQTLLPGGEVEWRWTLKASDAQDALITLGLTLTWQAKSANVAPGPVNVPIWGQALQVDVNYVFGLITVPQASIFGTGLAVLGLIAQFPLLEKMLEILLDVIFDRPKKRRTSRTQSRRR